ncbi:MAG: hypothetical protein LLF76_02835 [Planctomycetaceae bacterium]|nr:hypothetical protein [Planctomycetaceae bacterium]
MRIVVLSDLHCGHLVGLTHPDYQRQTVKGRRRLSKAAEFQSQLWDWYAKTIKSLRPIDRVIVNGDAIDGAGTRSGGTELIEVDRNEQVNMAIKAIEITDAKRYSMTYGTAYHTGDKEDYEDQVAKHFHATIGSHEWIHANGWVIDCKHHLGATQVPYGIYTNLAKEVLYNQLWADKGEQPRADILIRSHVHKFAQCASETGGQIVRAFSTPALQGYGSKYGARRCSATINVGLLVLDIEKGPNITITPILASLPCMRAA